MARYELPDASREDIPNAISVDQGIPLLDFELIQRWITQHVPGDRANDTWGSVQRLWLSELGQALGERYAVFRSKRALLLGRMERLVGEYSVGRVEHTLEMIDFLLPGLVADAFPGKYMVISFANDTHLERYARRIGCSTEWTGICVYEPAVHVLLRGTGPLSEVLLAHEMTHACLHHLPSPRWLREGLAQRMERFVTRWPYGELSENQRAQWRNRDLAGFWSGDWFNDERRIASAYKLAEFLLHQICNSPRIDLPGFIRSAHRDDGGRAAAENHLGRSLDDVLCDLLDPPPPPPSPAARFFRKLQSRFRTTS